MYHPTALCLACLVLASALPPIGSRAQAAPDNVRSPAGRRASITLLGAVGDGKTLNTGAIQKTIDDLAAAGGGTVVVPAGDFLSGALFLKPKVNLHLEQGAVLRCTTDMRHFPEQRTRIEGHFEEKFNPALLNADGCDGLRITGEGTLDGAGRPIWDQFWKLRGAAKDKKNFRNLSVPRARLCLIENSRDVELRGITFKDSQFWNLHLYKCDGVTVDGLKFEVPDEYQQAPSSDGIDVDSSRNITIRNCRFSVTDDCIALKGTKGPFALDDKSSPPVEHIRVSGCVFRRGHSLITCGSEATLVRDVVAEDCEVTGAMAVLTLKLRPDTPQQYEGITVRNIKVDSTGVQLFSINKWTQYFDLQGQPEPESFVGGITLSGLTGRIDSPGTIEGNKRTKFSRITLENVDVQAANPTLRKGGGVNDLVFKDVKVNGEIQR